MSGCGTLKCARRLYDGHGTSSYRANNPEVAAENAARLAHIQAERDAQDRIWQNSETAPESSKNVLSLPMMQPQLQPQPQPQLQSQLYVAKPVWPRSFHTQ